jgi:hypothetical protein
MEVLMSELFFSVATPGTAIYDGKHDLKTTVTTVYNGYLAAIDSSGSVIISTGSPVGMFYDKMALERFPTTSNLGDYLGGKKVNFASGAFKAFVGKGLFSTGALPTQNAKLYDNGAGKLALAGGTVIGVVENADIDMTHPEGTRKVALCRFDFTQII